MPEEIIPFRILRFPDKHDTNSDVDFSGLLSHYREQKRRYHFELSAPMPGFGPLTPYVHVSGTPEDFMRHRMRLCGQDYDFGQEINWRIEMEYLEASCMLCRHIHWLGLAEAYRTTGLDKYVTEIVSQLMSWDDQVPHDFPARGFMRALDVGIRLTNWCRIFPVIVQSPSFTATALRVMLANIRGAASARNKHGAEEGYCGGNHGVFEAMGVLNAAIYFPELPEAEIWRNDSFACLVQRAQSEVRPDGTHNEQSPGYHNAMLDCNVDLMALAEIANLELPPEVVALTSKMLDFALAFTRPDLRQATWSDSTDLPMRESLLKWAAKLRRTDALYLATNGLEGTVPAFRDKLFPDGGYVMMRSSWEDGPDAFWMMFDYGALGGWHGHYDLLSLVLHAHGRPLLVDPGCHKYDEHWRPLLRQTMMHNTLCLDRTNYLESPWDPHTPSRGRLIAIDLESPVRFVHASHDAYSTPFDPVTVERKVWMFPEGFWIVADRATAQRPHEYYLNWHVDSDEFIETTQFPNGFITQNATANLCIVPLMGSARPEICESWLHREGTFGPGKSLRYNGGPSSSWSMLTLLLPFYGSSLPLSQIEISAIQELKADIHITLAGRELNLGLIGLDSPVGITP